MNSRGTGILLQFTDSALPVGSYAHSFGLEGLVQSGHVVTGEDLRDFLLRDVRHSLINGELPLLLRAYQAVLDQKLAQLTHWDQVALAMRPTKQLREAASRIGRQSWLLYEKTWRKPGAFCGKDHFPHFQHPIVSGVIFAESSIPLTDAFCAFSYQTFSALVQSSLKLLPIGPTLAQTVLAEALDAIASDADTILTLTNEELGTFNPLWDIAASRHERADARLFIS
ncbi:MAG: urease accessory UreF family protein [Akkermansiaceae bacterium]